MTGGVIRYRLWPMKRRLLRSTLAIALVVVATSATWFSLASVLWSALVLVGLTLMVAVLLFPTEVTLDGPSLHLRHVGQTRTLDLRRFRRIERGRRALPRVELRAGGAFDPNPAIGPVRVPLPAEEAAAEEVMEHLRRWVGRQPTGRFEFDADLAPEDTAIEED